MNTIHLHSTQDGLATAADDPLAASRNTAGATNEVSVDDRRQYIARIPVEIDLHITAPEKKGIARSLDVSVAGLQVQTLLELNWEERVILTILHPEEDTHICALVARVAEVEDPNSGNKYGLRILSEDVPLWQGVLRRLIL